MRGGRMKALCVFLIRGLSSLRLAMLLTAWIVLYAALVSIRPSLSPGFPRHPLFLIPSFLFFLNLSLCTAARFAARLKNSKNPAKLSSQSSVPDIIHIGVLALMAGLALTLAFREEHAFAMSPGDSALLPGGSQLALLSSRIESYSGGRPLAWLAEVSIAEDGKVRHEVIRVNNPLSVTLSHPPARIRIYLQDYSETLRVTLSDGEGSVSLFPGEGLSSEELTLVYADASFEPARARFEILRGEETVSSFDAFQGSSAGPFVVTALRREQRLVFLAVRDPGAIVVFAGCLIIVCGFVLLVYRKTRGGL